jgi:hypothetical protein
MDKSCLYLYCLIGSNLREIRMNSDAKAAQTAHNLQLIRNAVAAGQGEEAKRLADKYKVPNAIRLDLGVELSNDPSKAPKISVG